LGVVILNLVDINVKLALRVIEYNKRWYHGHASFEMFDTWFFYEVIIWIRK